MNEYRRVMAALADAEAQRRSEVQSALSWYDSEISARIEETATATAAVESATERAKEAAALVNDVDRDAAKLWLALREHLGRGAGGRLGALPEPVQAADPPVPARHLRSAQILIDRARHPRAFPRWMYALLPIAGAACAALVYLVAQAILLLGDHLPGAVGVTVTVLGNVVVFLAPLAGLLAARYLTVREGARFDGAVVGPTVVGGMIAVSALIIALH